MTSHVRSTGEPVYNWRHGWVPLTMSAALAKAHGNHDQAKKLLGHAREAREAKKVRQAQTFTTPHPAHQVEHHTAQRFRVEHDEQGRIRVAENKPAAAEPTPQEKREAKRKPMTKGEATKLAAGAMRYGYYEGTEPGAGRTVSASCPLCRRKVTAYPMAWEKNPTKDLRAQMVVHMQEEHHAGELPARR